MQVYSDFFTSGLSNIPEPNNHVPEPSSHFSTLSQSMPSVSRTKSRRRHSMLAHIQDILKNIALSSSTKNDSDNTKKHRRISSLLSNPSKKWFDNISRRAPTRRKHSSGESPVATNDEPVENMNAEVQDLPAGPIDPFPPFLDWDSTSHFVHQPCMRNETCAHYMCNALMPITGLPRMNSFSYSAPAPNYFESRERPMSVQTLPSRRSPLPQWLMSSEKLSNLDLCMWHEDGLLLPSLPPEKEDLADIDWREFHDNWLYDPDLTESDTQR